MLRRILVSLFAAVLWASAQSQVSEIAYQFRRQYASPLDTFSTFTSADALNAYITATPSPAYAGQVVHVVINGVATGYVVQGTQGAFTLSDLGGGGGGGASFTDWQTDYNADYTDYLATRLLSADAFPRVNTDDTMEFLSTENAARHRIRRIPNAAEDYWGGLYFEHLPLAGGSYTTSGHIRDTNGALIWQAPVIFSGDFYTPATHTAALRLTHPHTINFFHMIPGPTVAASRGHMYFGHSVSADEPTNTGVIKYTGEFEWFGPHQAASYSYPSNQRAIPAAIEIGTTNAYTVAHTAGSFVQYTFGSATNDLVITITGPGTNYLAQTEVYWASGYTNRPVEWTNSTGALRWINDEPTTSEAQIMFMWTGTNAAAINTTVTQ